MANVAIAAPDASVVIPEDPPTPVWSLARRIVFRFLCCYYVLYSLPDEGRVNIFEVIPGVSILGKKYQDLWHVICPWAAIHLFHLSGKPTTYFPTGSGDTTLGYVQNLLFLVVALAGTLVWSLADFRRREYVQLEAWLRVLVRYTLAFTLFAYGLAKIFPLQFQSPGFIQLTETYGDFSPMGVLWNFMGASIPYIIFAGGSEVLGGLLLLFRRTTTLGAMVSFGVLLNVAVLNYCYDVPVKLYSTNLVLMCVYLAAPDMGRLFRFFVLNRPSPPADLTLPRFDRRWLRVSVMVFQVLFVGYELYSQVHEGWVGYRETYLSPKRPPLYGMYEVDTFVRNGQELPALLTDHTRWRRVIVQYPAGMLVRTMDDAPQFLRTEYDAEHNTVTLTGKDNSKKFPFRYSRPDPDHLVLEGTLDQDPLQVRLRKVDTSKYLLLNRGFHWINEMPFNR